MGMIFLKVFVLAHFATEADDFFSLSTCTDMGGSLLEFELFLPLCHRQAGYYSQKLCPCRVLCCSGFWLDGQDLVSLCHFTLVHGCTVDLLGLRKMKIHDHFF